ncbi:carbon storage regulator [Pseudomonas sp.]|uniref:carbon storage regulator n=1 Tax=Pseudomonas sp. TaxID=306 RepID=UPI0025829766|nr:carbon storage regulator [Pseudomonas sp.]
MALKIDLRPGQSVQIGDVVVKMVKKSGQVACLVIEADKSVPIRRPDDALQCQPGKLLAL